MGEIYYPTGLCFHIIADEGGSEEVSSGKGLLPLKEKAAKINS